MLATINTDASYSPPLSRGTWAFWSVCDRGRFRASGILKEEIPSPLYAEVQAIALAVHLTLGHELFSGVRKIIINTDCTPAIHLLTKNFKPDHDHAELRNKALGIMNQIHGVKKEFRHVKAHKNTSTARRYVNDWCDRRAKWEMSKIYNKTNEP